MDQKQYDAIHTKAKPIIAKMRKGEKVTPEEVKLVEESYKAKNELYALKPPMCYVAGWDVRKVIPIDFTYDKTYKQHLKWITRKVMRKVLETDIAFAKKSNVTMLVARAAQKAERTAQKATYIIERDARRAARKSLREKREKERIKMKEEIATRKIQREATKKARDHELVTKRKALLQNRAKKLGLTVS